MAYELYTGEAMADEAVSMQDIVLSGGGAVTVAAAEEEGLSGGQVVEGGKGEGNGECESVSDGYDNRRAHWDAANFEYELDLAGICARDRDEL